MNFFKIDDCDMLNGTGVRVVLWVAGCSHKCPGCQNAFTWDENAGELFTDKNKSQILEALKPEHIEGLTLSGGDPLYKNNRSTILDLVKEVKRVYPNKNIWLYTGYTAEECGTSRDIMEILEYVDYLVEGRFIQELLSPDKEWVGSSNQNVIKIKK